MRMREATGVVMGAWAGWGEAGWQEPPLSLKR
jgi:hypothetical protein